MFFISMIWYQKCLCRNSCHYIFHVHGSLSHVLLFLTAVQEKEDLSSDASIPEHRKEILPSVVESDLLLQVCYSSTLNILHYTSEIVYCCLLSCLLKSKNQSLSQRFNHVTIIVQKDWQVFHIYTFPTIIRFFVCVCVL